MVPDYSCGSEASRVSRNEASSYNYVYSLDPSAFIYWDSDIMNHARVCIISMRYSCGVGPNVVG
jgi:hypothetical protein